MTREHEVVSKGLPAFIGIGADLTEPDQYIPVDEASGPQMRAWANALAVQGDRAGARALRSYLGRKQAVNPPRSSLSIPADLQKVAGIPNIEIPYYLPERSIPDGDGDDG